LKAIAFVVLAGCSFATARGPNSDPAHGCSRTSGRADLVLAGAGIALTTISAIKYNLDDCPGDEESGRCSGEFAYRFGEFIGVTVGLVELIQGFYGLAVANECESARAKITAGT